MIENYGKQSTLLCDGCDDLFDRVDRRDFNEMIARARNDGWTIKPGGDGSFSHHCSKCAPPSRLEAQRQLLTRGVNRG